MESTLLHAWNHCSSEMSPMQNRYRGFYSVTNSLRDDGARALGGALGESDGFLSFKFIIYIL